MEGPGMGGPGIGPLGMGPLGMGGPGIEGPALGTPIMRRPGMGGAAMGLLGRMQPLLELPDVGPPGMGDAGVEGPAMGEPGMGEPRMEGLGMGEPCLEGAPGAQWQPQQETPDTENSLPGAEYEAVRQDMERLTRKVCVGAQGGPVLLNGVEYDTIPLAAFQLRMEALVERFKATLRNSELQRGLQSRGYTSDPDIGVEDLRMPQMEALVEEAFEKRFPKDKDSTEHPCSAPGPVEGDSSSARDHVPLAGVPPPFPGPALQATALGLSGAAERGGESGGASAHALPADSPFPARSMVEALGAFGEHALGAPVAGSGTSSAGPAAPAGAAVGGEWQGAGAGDQGGEVRERAMSRTLEQLVQKAKERERAIRAAPLLCLRELRQAEDEKGKGWKKKKGKRRMGEEAEEAGRAGGGAGEQAQREGPPGAGSLAAPRAALGSSSGSGQVGPEGRAKQARGLGEGSGSGRKPAWRQMWERLEDPRKSHTPNLVYSRIKMALEAREGAWAPVGLQDLVLRIEFLYPEHPGANFRKGQEFLVLGSQSLSELRDRIHCVHDFHAKDHNMLTPSAFFCIEDVLYDDLRRPEAVEYSKAFLDWNQKQRQEGEGSDTKQMGPGPSSATGLSSGARSRPPKPTPAPATPVYSSARMEDTVFCELKIRPGAHYVYFHQGGCKHAFKVTDVHLLHPQDCDNAMAYPLLTHEPRYMVRKCMVCDVAGSTRLVYKDRLSNVDPIFYCAHCYHSLHYTSGQKLLYNDFQVFDYHHE